MSDNKYTFFEPPRKMDTTGPKIDIVERIQEIFAGASPVKQQQHLNSDQLLPESTHDIFEGAIQEDQSIKELDERVTESNYVSEESDTPYTYQIPKLESPDQQNTQQTRELAKPPIVEKIQEILTELSPTVKDIPMPDLLQEDTAFPTEEDQYVDQATVDAKVSKTEVTIYSPSDVPRDKSCVSVTGGIIADCESMEVVRPPILTTPVVAKIPVVLSEFQFKLNLHSTITLPEAALEIKEVHKTTKITQCLLLQEPNVTLSAGDTGDLFLKGFIRKNISYITRDCSNTEGVCGDIHHCTVDVPFQCVTTVTFLIPPIAPISNTVVDFQYFRKENLNGPTFAEKDQLLSGDFSEFNQVSTEYFNELPFCELVSSRILEFDEYLGRRELPCEAPLEIKKFNQIEEKTVLTIQMKLLQNQQVPLEFSDNEDLRTSVKESYLPPPDLAELQEDQPEDDLVEEQPLPQDLEELIEETARAEEAFPRRNNLAMLNAAVADFLDGDEKEILENEPHEEMLEECPTETEEE